MTSRIVTPLFGIDPTPPPLVLARLRTRAMFASLSSKISTTALRVVPNVAGERKRRAAVIECAHKKGTGSTKNGRDSNPQYLGVKKYGEEKVTVGSIIVRQVGNKVREDDARGASRRGEGGARDALEG